MGREKAFLFLRTSRILETNNQSRLHNTLIAKETRSLMTSRMASLSASLSDLSQDSLGLDILSKEVLMYALGFLDLDSIRQIARASHGYRDIIFSHDANALWLSLSRYRWGDVDRDTYLIDKLDVPKALAEDEMNLPLLLLMTPQALPSKVDEKRQLVASDLIKICKGENTGEFSIRYAGEVGGHDVHSIRSDNPLPRPCLRKKGKRFRLPFRKNTAKWNPFVAPFMEKDLSVNVTPRVVSYFEVSIIKCLNQRRPALSFDSLDGERKDCIAIGLATDTFDCQSALPGHNFSFAYHSDDGGIYHGTGRQQKHASPFGPGDIVGCGVDYVTGSIFFTRNAKFLGCGWQGLGVDFLSQTDLYPVVGIDSEDSVSMNYGHKPFEFDLSEYCTKYHRSLSALYPVQEERKRKMVNLPTADSADCRKENRPDENRHEHSRLS
jgi:hypothetical protein